MRRFKEMSKIKIGKMRLIHMENRLFELVDEIKDEMNMDQELFDKTYEAIDKIVDLYNCIKGTGSVAGLKFGRCDEGDEPGQPAPHVIENTPLSCDTDLLDSNEVYKEAFKRQLWEDNVLKNWKAPPSNLN